MIRCKAGTKFFLEESKFGRNQQWRTLEPQMLLFFNCKSSSREIKIDSFVAVEQHFIVIQQIFVHKI